MQTSALRTLLNNDSSDSLEYFNAQLPKIKINPIEPVQPVDLRPLTLDDDEVSIECLTPSPSQTLVDNPIKPLPTREERHRTVHTTQDIEARDNVAEAFADKTRNEATDHVAALDASKTRFPHYVARSHAKAVTKDYIETAADNFCAAFNETAAPAAHTAPPSAKQACANLRHIYRILHPLSDSKDDDSISTRSSGWDSNNDEEYNALWPPPPTTPVEEDDMHPPQLTVCGPYPGQGWRINSIGTTHYYQLLVRDPSSERNVVAPFISHALNRAALIVSGTYGLEYPIKTRPLTALGVDYATAMITPE